MADISMENVISRKLKNSQEKKSITIGVNCKLTLSDAKLLSVKALPVHLNQESYTAMERSHQFLKNCIDQRMPIYGINTHFGDQVNFLEPYLKNSDVNESDYYKSINNRQENLIKAHSCALGDIIRPDIIRIAMMLRAHCLHKAILAFRMKQWMPLLLI